MRNLKDSSTIQIQPASGIKNNIKTKKSEKIKTGGAGAWGGTLCNRRVFPRSAWTVLRNPYHSLNRLLLSSLGARHFSGRCFHSLIYTWFLLEQLKTVFKYFYSILINICIIPSVVGHILFSLLNYGIKLNKIRKHLEKYVLLPNSIIHAYTPSVWQCYSRF